MNYPGHSLTLIVKGTFTLSPGQKVAAADEQLYPTGDEPYPDDTEAAGAPRYESDFAYFKPRADLLLVGKCNAPGGRPAPSCLATFQVGDQPHSIAVFGDRLWKRNAIGFRNPTDPLPFQSMDLRYEKSYGGQGFGNNPAGKGFAQVEDETGTAVFPLPNLEDPLQLIDSPRAHPQPVGFGPLSRNWNQRREKIGTYTSSYAKQRWPWFPEDFDWSYFNSAPPEMQASYLRGDERLYFENLHPQHAQYEAWLPGKRIRCFVSKSDDQADAAGFAEAPMKLDTLWVDMEAGQLELVWRGWVETSSEEHEDIRHIFIKSEEVSARTDSIGDCHRQFLTFLADEKRKWEEAGDETQSADAAPAEERVPADDRSETNEAEELKKQIEAQTSSLLAKAGLDLNGLPSEVRTRMEREQARVLALLTGRAPAQAMEAGQQELHSHLSDAFRSLGMDANHLPPLSAKAKAEQLRFMKELNLGEGVSAGPELSQFWTMLSAIMPQVGIHPENLDSLIAEAKKLKQRLGKGLAAEPEERESTTPNDSPSAPLKLTREIVQERALRGESFAGEDLRDVDLSELQLSGVDFSNAILTGVCLQRATLEDANLYGANLEGANLASASLRRTILTQANLTRCDLTGTSLEEIDATEAVLQQANLSKAAIASAVFERANMAQVSLDDATGEGAIFCEADLAGATLKKASLPASDFSKALLEGVNFQDANLSDANFEAASGSSANFRCANLSGLRASEGCNFSGSCFVKANAAESCWEEACLSGADFSYARLEAATFTKALLEGANFYGSNAKFGRFRKANLKNAKLTQMNLFEATLEKADLTGADLQGSNLYGAEFLDARIDTARFDGANLKMTKLA